MNPVYFTVMFLSIKLDLDIHLPYHIYLFTQCYIVSLVMLLDSKHVSFALYCRQLASARPGFPLFEIYFTIRDGEYKQQVLDCDILQNSLLCIIHLSMLFNLLVHV